MAAVSALAASRPKVPIPPQTSITVPVSIATPSTFPVRISVAEADDSRTSRILLAFSSITLFSRMEAPVITSDQSRKPETRPMIVGSRSRNDTSPPVADFGDRAVMSGRNRSVSSTTAALIPACSKASRRFASFRTSRTKSSTVSSVARRVQTRAAGLPSIRFSRTTESSWSASGTASPR